MGASCKSAKTHFVNENLFLWDDISKLKTLYKLKTESSWHFHWIWQLSFHFHITFFKLLQKIELENSVNG